MQITSLVHRFRRKAGEAPSLHDVLPGADALPRSMPRVEIVPAEAIIGTTRHPSTLTVDFLPRREQRTAHWRHDFDRIVDGQNELAVLPPVELLKVGECYFVVDGHKRVAVARRTRAALDAIVVELHLPERERAAAWRCPVPQWA